MSDTAGHVADAVVQQLLAHRSPLPYTVSAFKYGTLAAINGKSISTK